MLKRRDVLRVGAGGLAVLAAGVADAQTAPPVAPPDPYAPTPFTQNSVTDMARALAQRPYRAAAPDLPDPFGNLTYEQYNGIKSRPGSAVWAGDNVGFAIEPLHRGFVFSTPVQIHVVENGQARRLAYNPGDFTFGALKAPGESKDIGFSGIRILQTREGAAPAEVAIFQGATFFRAIARGQRFGATARGLAIRTADPKGEEFPVFRTMWIERSSLASNALVLHALLDSESMTGAYRFTLRAGETTIIDTECTLFARVAVDHFGVGAMASTYVAGPLDRRRVDDVRPSIFDAAGLQMLNGHDEWIWRPVASRDTLQISGFVDENPRGFGFQIRDRDFERFLDDDNHWERRPSLWIEPIGDWGAGNVTLDEIPSDSEVNQNVIAYWRPRTVLAAGAEASFAYRQFWGWNAPNRPPGATVDSSRSGRIQGNTSARRRRFLVQFSGPIFSDAQVNRQITANLTAFPGTVSGQRLFLDADEKRLRVVFDIDTGSDASCEIRLVLEASGKPVSETWLYRWTP